MGPIDYVVVGFKGNNFDGSIVRALGDAVKQGIIRVIDLVFVLKDPEGNVMAGEYEDQPAELKESLKELSLDEDLPLFTENDIQSVAKELPDDTAAGVLVIEHLWAKDLKQAIKNAGGVLVADGRIHPAAVEAAAKELKESE